MVDVPSTSTRSDNDIFVASEINSSSERSQSGKRADYLLETHVIRECWFDRLASRRENGVRDWVLGVVMNDRTEAIRRPAWGRHGRPAGRRSSLYLVKLPL